MDSLDDNGTPQLTITDVQTQRKRSERRSIFINDEFAFGVSEEMYVKYALFKGRRVDNVFLEEVKRQEELYQARQMALRFVNRRMRTVAEIVAKLREKEFSEEAIESTLQFLREYGMLDDLRFARAYINDQLLRRPVGRRRLEMELRRKGLEKDEVGELVATAIDDESELANAMSAAEKKASTLRSDDPQKFDRSISSFLAGRGFTWEVISKVLSYFREARKSGA